MQTREADPLVVVEPLAVKPSTCAKLIDAGLTTVYALIKEGRLKTVSVGSDKRVTMESIRALVR